MKTYNKVMAGALAAAVSAGATGSIAYAKNSGKTATARAHTRTRLFTSSATAIPQ